MSEKGITIDTSKKTACSRFERLISAKEVYVSDKVTNQKKYKYKISLAPLFKGGCRRCERVHALLGDSFEAGEPTGTLKTLLEQKALSAISALQEHLLAEADVHLRDAGQEEVVDVAGAAPPAQEVVMTDRAVDEVLLALKKWKVARLTRLLQTLGQPYSGKKQDKIDRIIAYSRTDAATLSGFMLRDCLLSNADTMDRAEIKRGRVRFRSSLPIPKPKKC